MAFTLTSNLLKQSTINLVCILPAPTEETDAGAVSLLFDYLDYTHCSQHEEVWQVLADKIRHAQRWVPNISLHTDMWAYEELIRLKCCTLTFHRSCKLLQTLAIYHSFKISRTMAFQQHSFKIPCTWHFNEIHLKHHPVHTFLARHTCSCQVAYPL